MHGDFLYLNIDCNNCKVVKPMTVTVKVVQHPIDTTLNPKPFPPQVPSPDTGERETVKLNVLNIETVEDLKERIHRYFKLYWDTFG